MYDVEEDQVSEEDLTLDIAPQLSSPKICDRVEFWPLVIGHWIYGIWLSVLGFGYMGKFRVLRKGVWSGQRDE
uniref:Uncharacterized protein n=1 Tax=Rhizophagus irregularis (strain DAOM 181602 / DAOM 197198 / MUCL 43194) TaxID=747089 RepID=U9SXR4_RHIID